MRRVIDGKVYDTDKASLIAEDSFGYVNDFKHWEERLYKTKKGNYFLHGEGGPLSHYSKPLGNNSTGGSEKIIPMTKKEAFDWCQEHSIDADIIQSEFPDLVEEA